MANLTLGRSHKFQPSTKQRVIFHVQNSKKKKERENPLTTSPPGQMVLILLYKDLKKANLNQVINSQTPVFCCRV